jgi:hypothetical protein
MKQCFASSGWQIIKETSGNGSSRGFDNCISQTGSEISHTRITVISWEINCRKSVRIWQVNMLLLFSSMEFICSLEDAVNRWVFRRPSASVLSFFCFHFMLLFHRMLSWAASRLPLVFRLGRHGYPHSFYYKYFYYLLLTIEGGIAQSV